MFDISKLFAIYVNNPSDPENNFLLALAYDSIGQTAAAISFYIRTAERTSNDLLKYECLIRAAQCFELQGSRGLSVRGLLQHAIAILPKRPEAYYLLAKYFEQDTFKHQDRVEGWFNAYTYSSIALEVCDFNSPPLRTSINYPGKFGLLFEKAVTSWWCGLCAESRELFKHLLRDYDLDNDHRRAVIANLNKFGELDTKEIVGYTADDHARLKFKFPGSGTIAKNFAESFQDMFVLTATKGKKNGTYLEIGSGYPFYGNNTALLEQQFNWNGLSIDMHPDSERLYNEQRKNKCITRDATNVDFENMLAGLNFPVDIDYLQLDCDPPDVTFAILKNLPFDTRRFAVITYEHDDYCDETKSFKEKSRELLLSKGYVLVVDDVAPDEWRNYEDWWVHPELIDAKTIKKITCVTGKTKSADSYIFKN